MSEVNWLVTLLIGAIVSIPLSIFANLFTPQIQKWVDGLFVSNRGKTLGSLRKEYNEIKELRADPQRTQLLVFWQILSYILSIFIELFLLIPIIVGMWVGVSSTNLILSGNIFFMVAIAIALGLIFLAFTVILLTTINSALSWMRRIYFLTHYKEYELKITNRISELEKKVGVSKENTPG